MKAYPNFREYHKLIESYLNLVPINEIRTNSSSSDSFFFELIHRTFQEKIRKKGYEGIGDISGTSLYLSEDYNTNFIAAAGQKINEIRRPRDYWAFNLEMPKERIGVFEDELTMQLLQEKSSKRLLDIYGIEELFNPSQLLIKGEDDWKSGRCAFWRYLMYSGFTQVDNDQNPPIIITESIPRKNLLSKLAARFIDLFKLREDYEKRTSSSKTGEPRNDFLDPKRMAINFLRFNGIEES